MCPLWREGHSDSSSDGCFRLHSSWWVFFLFVCLFVLSSTSMQATPRGPRHAVPHAMPWVGIRGKQTYVQHLATLIRASARELISWQSGEDSERCELWLCGCKTVNIRGCFHSLGISGHGYHGGSQEIFVLIYLQRPPILIVKSTVTSRSLLTLPPPGHPLLHHHTTVHFPFWAAGSKFNPCSNLEKLCLFVFFKKLGENTRGNLIRGFNKTTLLKHFYCCTLPQESALLFI